MVCLVSCYSGVLRSRDGRPQPGHGKSERQARGVLEGTELAAWPAPTGTRRVQSQCEFAKFKSRNGIT